MASPSLKHFASKQRWLGLIAATITTFGLMSSAWAEEEKVLNIYNWADYIAPDTVANFEKETGIKVRYDVIDSNETLHAKLIAGKTGYDIVVPTSYWAKTQMQAGLLKKLDKSKLTNWGNLDPVILEKLAKSDPGNQYLVDWLWGYDAIGINVDKVKAALGNTPMPENAWDLIFNPKYISKLKSCGVSFVDSPSEVIPAAMLYVGKNPYSKNVADYTAAATMLSTIRPYVTTFSSLGYINDLANGSICVAFGWSGDINIARQRAIETKTGQNIQALVPKTGSLLFFDTMAIPADAPHPNNAHLWMNYIMQPKVHASLTNTVFYANPNKASAKYVNPEIANNKTVFLSDEDKAKMISPDAVPNNVRRAMTRIYTKFKTGV